MNPLAAEPGIPLAPATQFAAGFRAR